jgi:hypothetical protein
VRERESPGFNVDPLSDVVSFDRLFLLLFTFSSNFQGSPYVLRPCDKILRRARGVILRNGRHNTTLNVLTGVRSKQQT